MSAAASSRPDPVRVLWAIKGLGPGGAEHLLVAAAAAADRAAFRYDVAYLLPWKDHLVPQLESAGITAHCLGAAGSYDLRWVPRLRQLVAEGAFDVVHFHSPYVAALGRLAIRSLPARSRPATMSTEHNAWSTFAWPTRALNALTAPFDAAVLTVSDETRASMWRPVRGRAETLVHGIALDALRAAAASREHARAEVRAELGIAPEAFVAVTVANFRAQKDYPNLLDAARIARGRIPGLRLVAVGQGPLEADVRERCTALDLDDVVVLTGYRRDPARVLAAGDVFVLASRWEGLPVALMEACALGLPVVATAVGGIPDVVRDGTEAILVAPGDPAALAEAVATLAEDPQRRAALALAASRRANVFDIRRAQAHIEDVYRRLAYRERPHGKR